MARTISSHKGKNNGNYKHGGKGTKLYQVWCSMKRRCNSPTSNAYKHYGGRGIKVCAEWENDYSAFKEWAMNNGYKEGLTLDRINNNGNYEPSNCRWVTMKEQSNNQRNTLRIEYKGETKTFHQWAEHLGIHPSTLYFRLYRLGWSIEKAFNEKVSHYQTEKGGGEG